MADNVDVCAWMICSGSCGTKAGEDAGDVGLEWRGFSLAAGDVRFGGSDCLC